MIASREFLGLNLWNYSDYIFTDIDSASCGISTFILFIFIEFKISR